VGNIKREEDANIQQRSRQQEKWSGRETDRPKEQRAEIHSKKYTSTYRSIFDTQTTVPPFPLSFRTSLLTTPSCSAFLPSLPRPCFLSLSLPKQNISIIGQLKERKYFGSSALVQEDGKTDSKKFD
jgi:hypothetical protein